MYKPASVTSRRRRADRGRDDDRSVPSKRACSYATHLASIR
jgi:hypothetical protein